MFEIDDKFLRLKAVIEKTGKPKASIYREIKNGTFPPPERIGPRAVGWRLSKLLKWMNAPDRYQSD